VGGTADVITITPSPAITAYTAGQTFRFIASGTNTTNVTVNANALGAKAITKNGTNALTAGDIPSGTMVTITYDGTRFILGAVHREQPQPNPIINGNMDIWQRGTSFAAPANATYFADRWRIAYSTTGVVTASRSTSVPTVAESGVLFNYSLDLDVTTADAAIAAGDYCALQQSIEGFNWRHFAQRDVTLSFWVYATKTGTHCISISNSGLDRSYVAEYTVSSTNTWEYKTITITASPSAGTWDYTTGIGATVRFAVLAGSTYQTTAGSWQVGNYLATSSVVNDLDSDSNYFRITGVKLERGTVATPIQFIPFAEEMVRCQRYCQKSFPYGTAPAQNAGTDGVTRFVHTVGSNNTNYHPNIAFPVLMRTGPTVTLYNPSAANAQAYQVNIGGDNSSTTVEAASDRSMTINFVGNLGSIVGHRSIVHWLADAEL
jgi:hypothetical protein